MTGDDFIRDFAYPKAKNRSIFRWIEIYVEGRPFRFHNNVGWVRTAKLIIDAGLRGFGIDVNELSPASLLSFIG